MRAALVQMSAGEDVAENLARTEARLEAAKRERADVVCLQECFNTWFFAQRIDARAQALAEPVDGPSVTRMRACAKRLGLFLVVPFYERAMAGELYNTALLVDDRGRDPRDLPQAPPPDELALQREVLLPPREHGLPGLRHAAWAYRDHDLLRPPLPGVRPGPRRRGAEYVFVPTATTTRGYSRSVWETELRAHAIANGFYVAGVNRVGVELESTYYGASVFIDPIGEIVAQAGDGDEVLVADLPRARIEEVREVWPFYRDRRPDAYASLVRP